MLSQKYFKRAEYFAIKRHAYYTSDHKRSIFNNVIKYISLHASKITLLYKIHRRDTTTIYNMREKYHIPKRCSSCKKIVYMFANL